MLPAAGKRPPRRARRHLPRRAGPGQDPDHPLAHRPARRVDAGVAGSEILDDPYHPVSRHARDLVAEHGDDTPIEWVHRDFRFGEKLATPDTSIADLIGEVDPIKVAEGRYLVRRADLALRAGAADQPGHLRHQRAPRSGRTDPGRPAQRARGTGHPDPRLQDPPAAGRHAGGLGQPGGLHQPRPDHHAAEGPLRGPDPHPLPPRRRHRDGGGRPGGQPRSTLAASGSRCPPYMAEIVATISHLARQSPHINQRSGVSVRLSVANYETLVASAVRRALRLGEHEAVPRVSDLDALVSSTSGKVEIETIDEGRDGQVVDRLIQAGGAGRVQEPACRRSACESAVADFDAEDSRVVHTGRRHRRGPVRRGPRPASGPAHRWCSGWPARSPRPPSPAPPSSFSKACTSPSASTRTPPGGRATYRAR